MCEMFMEKLDDLSIGYAWTDGRLVVDIEDVEHMILVDLMEHLDMKGMPYTISDTTLEVTPPEEPTYLDEAPTDSMEEAAMLVGINIHSTPKEDTTDWEQIGLEIELFARQYIPEREDAFGKFMYHAELIKNGHMDVSMKDRDQIVEPYKSILIKILEKGGTYNV